MMTFRVLNLFLFEQGGTEGIMLYTTFIDIRNDVSSCSHK